MPADDPAEQRPELVELLQRFHRSSCRLLPASATRGRRAELGGLAVAAELDEPGGVSVLVVSRAPIMTSGAPGGIGQMPHSRRGPSVG